RIILALKYGAAVMELSPKRLAFNAMWESVSLARDGHVSWASELRGVMAGLPIPVLWNLNRDENISAGHFEGLVVQVTRSMEVYLQHEIDHSSRVRDLLFGRREWDKESRSFVFKVLAFRHYLRVSNPQHRRAFVHVMLSGHALAMERMRWSERGKAIVPREWRLCRFCYVGQEDVIHALLLCPETRLVSRRAEFY
ncbi:hypothetical protein C8J56DRAFT_710412, partial [Mycena floridula]